MQRLSLPGQVIKVSGSGTLDAQKLWPTRAAAKRMLARAMQELTGKSELGEAFAQLLHPDDRVAIKPNGIGGKRGGKMVTSRELILEVVHGVVAAGVPPSHITIYEQFATFLRGTRIVGSALKPDSELPEGVSAVVHRERDAVMDAIRVSGIKTKFVRPFTEATAVINVPLIKDHSLCGYTGALKNITHGSITNPSAYHAHKASPQIAELYAQDVVKSRVVLHIVDAYKVMYDGGPLDRKPHRRIPYEALYASTDPVALDAVGWQLVDELRQDNGLPSLEAAGRKPTYIAIAGQLGLGVADRSRISMREVRA